MAERNDAIVKIGHSIFEFIHHNRADKANKAIKLTASVALYLVGFEATLPQNASIASCHLMAALDALST